MTGTGRADAGPGTRRLRVGEVELDLDGILVRVAGERIALTYREFLVLQVLMERAGRVVSRDELLAAAWEAPRPRRRMVDIYVRRVRARLGDGAGDADRAGGAGRHVRTVRGQGYVFDLPRGPRSAEVPQQRGGGE